MDFFSLNLLSCTFNASCFFCAQMKTDDEGVFILETTPIKIQMFHHRVKVITQNNFDLTFQ